MCSGCKLNDCVQSWFIWHKSTGRFPALNTRPKQATPSDNHANTHWLHLIGRMPLVSRVYLKLDQHGNFLLYYENSSVKFLNNCQKTVGVKTVPTTDWSVWQPGSCFCVWIISASRAENKKVSSLCMLSVQVAVCQVINAAASQQFRPVFPDVSQLMEVWLVFLQVITLPVFSREPRWHQRTFSTLWRI